MHNFDEQYRKWRSNIKKEENKMLLDLDTKKR